MKVCCKLFPKGTVPYQKEDGFYMDGYLKQQLDVMIKNIADDWDFTVIISGSGEVRVGKSMLAMQIGAYITEQVNLLYNKNNPFNVQDNLVFEGKRLIKIGNELGKNKPYSVLIYDEAAADLDSKKIMTRSTSIVMDYIRECGQYNLFNILVVPEFFDLPKGIAMTRSIFLLDVTYNFDDEGYFQRGYFSFFSRRNKKILYIKGKRELNYNAAKPNFKGRFFKFYPVNEQEYREMKQKVLVKRDIDRKDRVLLQRNAAWYLLVSRGMKMTQIGAITNEITGIYTPEQTISDAIHGGGITVTDTAGHNNINIQQKRRRKKQGGSSDGP